MLKEKSLSGWQWLSILESFSQLQFSHSYALESKEKYLSQAHLEIQT